MPSERIEQRIVVLRGHNMFQLTPQETEMLRLQFATSNITIMRTFVARFKAVFDAIRQLMAPPARPKGPIGFHP